MCIRDSFKDTALALAPLSREEAGRMVKKLRGSVMLEGYRGNPPLDVEALIDAILAVSQLATEHKDTLLELDLNPMFVYEKGVCSADAVVITDTQLS